MPSVRIKDLLPGRSAEAPASRGSLPRCQSCPTVSSHTPEAIPCEYIPRSKSAVFSHEERPKQISHKHSLPFCICPFGSGMPPPHVPQVNPNCCPHSPNYYSPQNPFCHPMQNQSDPRPNQMNIPNEMNPPPIEMQNQMCNPVPNLASNANPCNPICCNAVCGPQSSAEGAQQHSPLDGLKPLAAVGSCCPCGPGIGPCSPCGCGCCACGPNGACLPPPCNQPPKCMQYMTGYYYYPYGWWFCGPYHVTGTCVPGGPVMPGPCGPCGPAPPCPGGPCGPCCIGPCGSCPCCVFGVDGLGAKAKKVKPAIKNSSPTDLSSSLAPLGASIINLPPSLLVSCLALMPECISAAVASGNPFADIPNVLAAPKCGPCGPCCGCGPCGCCGPCSCPWPGGCPPGGCGCCGCGCGPCGCGPCGCGPCGCGPCGCGPCGCGPCGCGPCGCGPCGPCGCGCGPCGCCGGPPCGCGPCGCGPCGCGPCGPCGPCAPCGCGPCGCCCSCPVVKIPPSIAPGGPNGPVTIGPLGKCCICGDCRASSCDKASDPDAVCFCAACRAKRAPTIVAPPMSPCPTNLTPKQTPNKVIINPSLAKNFPFNKNKFFERNPPPPNTIPIRFFTTSHQRRSDVRKFEFGNAEVTVFDLRREGKVRGETRKEMSCSHLPPAYEIEELHSIGERDHHHSSSLNNIKYNFIKLGSDERRHQKIAPPKHIVCNEKRRNNKARITKK